MNMQIQTNLIYLFVYVFSLNKLTYVLFSLLSVDKTRSKEYEAYNAHKSIRLTNCRICTIKLHVKFEPNQFIKG